MPVYDELFKYQDKIHHVLTRHEQGATHSAQGFARISGKVGVAIATSGPGATNLITGYCRCANRFYTNGMYYGSSTLSFIREVMHFKKQILLVFQHRLQNGTVK